MKKKVKNKPDAHRALGVNKDKKNNCKHENIYYDDRSLGMICKECRCLIPD